MSVCVEKKIRMRGPVMVTTKGGGGCSGGKGRRGGGEEEHQQQNQVSPAAVLLAALRKSMVACSVESPDDVVSAVHPMEIGWPTNVKHVSHVTFDRFNGFLGLPLELELDIPAPVPSARYLLYFILLSFLTWFLVTYNIIYSNGVCLKCSKIPSSFFNLVFGGSVFVCVRERVACEV